MSERAPLATPVLIGGCIIMMTFADRASFGVFQTPIAKDFNWPRAEFSLAIAIQSLAWGIGQPFFGALAEKFYRRAIVAGAAFYAGGMILSALPETALAHQFLNIFIGFGIAGMGFGVVLAVVGRAASDENRSMALGVATAAGSAGQVFGAPLAEFLLTTMDWQGVFLVFAAIIGASLLALPLLRAPERASRAELEESLGEVLVRAFRDPSFTLIFLGFFSCGFQLAFVTELCGPIAPGGILHGIGITTTSALGAVSISLIGLTNIAGTLTAGWLGKRHAKKYLLAAIYTGRTIVASVFILLPITPLSAILFSVATGALWLATVPLTSGLVAHIYRLRNMGTLHGIVFFSHQLGGFLGVWLGGRLYHACGDYTLVWWIGVGVGAFSAIVHLPIREKRLELATAYPLAAARM